MTCHAQCQLLVVHPPPHQLCVGEGLSTAIGGSGPCLSNDDPTARVDPGLVASVLLPLLLLLLLLLPE